MARHRIRQQATPSLKGRSALTWIGPGLMWAIGAVGAVEVLMTPRIATIYRYDLLWVIVLYGIMNRLVLREVGRYVVVTGQTILGGYAQLLGPRQ